MKDSRIEQFLKANGITFSYCAEIPLSKIVIDAGARSQIRLEEKTLDDETVLRYAEAASQGAKFPALVLHQVHGDGYAVDNGLHRLASYRLADIESTDAYVCDLDEPKDAKTISRLRRTVNIIEGRAPTAEEALLQAVQLVREGMTSVDAAKVTCLKAGRVLKRIQYDKSFDRLAEHSGLKASEVERLGRSAIEDLGKVAHPRLAGEMAKFAYEARLNSLEIQEFSRQVRDVSTDADREVVIKRWRTDHADRIKQTAGGRLAPPSSRIRNLKLYGHKVSRELESQSLKALERKDRTEAVRFLKKLVAQIQAVIRRLEGNGGTAAKPSVYRPRSSAH